MTLNPAIASAVASADPAPIEADAVIIGAGPVGLFQIFELGLLEVHAHVIDSLAKPGGQPIELYPDKPIYDIPAIPVCTGRELTEALLKQAEPFKPTFHLGQEVSKLARREDGRFDLETSLGKRFITKTVFIAAGVGAFTPRKPKVEGITQFEANGQLAYRVKDPQIYAGKHLVILGGGDSALDWTLALQPIAASVTLVHRREGFRAQPASVAKMKALAEAHQLLHITGQLTGFEAENGILKEVKITSLDGVTRRLPLDHLLCFFGLSPRLGPIAEWGLDLEKRQVKVDTEKFETSIPGIFAVGDINTYPGKKKLILSGFHEAALAAFGATRYIFPEKKVTLQYTTTSTKLHQILGVPSPVFD
ncbi:MAG: NAD(P)/FAD-dependent oxidoreductase [Casimicrobiaceae bacterium]|nr:NAD(P)/FAD-dependent oxidoreductase [Casimicrobiaceae bacterium]MCX8099132.1 NAD(P)/FAD-dependent oxidoreductase [Casimicrobiaceae bacterium]MDW8312199.1 NAD(P)/FAD-dependent oxidoreductase [Burkholderiales bacterium]